MNDNNNLNQNNNTVQNGVTPQQPVVSNNQQPVTPTNVGQPAQPTPAVNNVVNTPQTVSTPQPQPGVVGQQPQVSQQVEQPQPAAPQEKMSTFKFIIAIIFFIAFSGFVIFIPEISKFVKSKMNEQNKTTESNVVSNGTLTCKKDSTSDETDVNYTLEFTFEDKKLILSSYTITHESLNKDYINQKEAECNLIAEKSKEIKGIETTCKNKQGILVMKEEYTNQDIDRNNLTAYTEAGGTYPEFEYGENVYDIQTNLVKKGYDCSISSVER